MLYDCSKWIEDIDAVLNVIPEIEQLTGRSVLITGAAGLVCSAVVDVLFRYNDTHDSHIHIICAGRSIEKMKERFADMVHRPDFTYVQYDATKSDNRFPIKVDYIIHGASNAFPSLVMKEPVETMLGNFLGIKNLLDLAKKCGAKRVLYISSSEIYGQKDNNEPFSEGEYGFVDLLNPRSSYAISKRAAETLCVSYSAEYAIETVIVRPGHIYGPTASPADTRVSSAWAFDAANGNDIIMKSDGEQIRSYCYCLDCASAILKVLLSGENNHSYNISNRDSIISIRQMANILAKITGIQLRMELPKESEKKSFNPMRNASLRSDNLNNLGWYGRFDAENGFRRTVEILREVRDR